jgi:Holliday junction resolvase RusA-like endonuclease
MRTPGKTVAYEECVAWAAFDAMTAAGYTHGQWTGPVEVSIEAQFLPPVSWSKKKRDAAIGRQVTTKPDADNIAKIICDALNGVVWVDDSQVSVLTVRKYYGPVAQVVVEVERL